MTAPAVLPPGKSPTQVPPEGSLIAGHVGLIVGPLLLVGWLTLTDRGPLTPEAHRLAGVLLLTLVWWATEPIPVSVTGLLAVALSVVLGAVPADERSSQGIKAVFAPFADPAVFFLLGGLFLGRAMSRHGLDRRLALALLATRWAGRSPGTLLAAVGLSVTLISMWVSNAAAAAMMTPVTVGVITVLASSRAEAADGRSSGFAHSPYATALLLITAFGASVGGVATPIGTATNLVAVGYLARPDVLGRQVGFLSWCAVGVPLAILIFAAMFAWLRIRTRAGALDLATLRDHLVSERAGLGRWTRGELNTLAVFVSAVILWITPGLLSIIDPSPASLSGALKRLFPEEVVAVLATVLLFLLPAGRGFTLEADDLRRIDWGTLLLFGAALSIGGLMDRTGLAHAAGRAAFELLDTRNLWLLTAVAIASGILLSEFTSNTAAAAALLPVVLRLCVEAGVDPIPPMFGLTFAASFGSALPVSTPPNAIVYGTGLVPVRRMISGGVGFDVLAGVVILATLWVAFELLRWSPLAAS